MNLELVHILPISASASRTGTSRTYLVVLVRLELVQLEPKSQVEKMKNAKYRSLEKTQQTTG